MKKFATLNTNTTATTNITATVTPVTNAALEAAIAKNIKDLAYAVVEQAIHDLACPYGDTENARQSCFNSAYGFLADLAREGNTIAKEALRLYNADRKAFCAALERAAVVVKHPKAEAKNEIEVCKTFDDLNELFKYAMKAADNLYADGTKEEVFVRSENEHYKIIYFEDGTYTVHSMNE